MNKEELSIIIPTYSRSSNLILILDSLSKQIPNDHLIKVIICDSYSEDSSEINVKKFSENNIDLKIIYLNIVTLNESEALLLFARRLKM